MVIKYNGTWTLHCPTHEQEVLLNFLEKLDTDEEPRHEFFKSQREIIMKACYNPYIVRFAEPGEEPQYSGEDLMVLEEVKFYKENFVHMLSTNFSIAYFNGTISEAEKDEFDNYIQTLFGYWWVKERPRSLFYVDKKT